MTDVSDDNFRPEFKRYKRKSPAPCLNDVLDADNDVHANLLYTLDISHLSLEEISQKCKSDAAKFGLKSPDKWQCYGAHGFPGFQFIRDPFIPGAQRYWVKRCLADYPCKPNVTNLDMHHPEEQLTNPWQNSRIKYSSPSHTKDKTLIDHLRWVTLGYHYDWNNKVYNQDHHSPFPQDLDLMSAQIARMLGYPAFQPQAAIVNFYHMDSTLGGHTDHSEFDLSAPLISYSLGQSAILLIGGKTKATKPLALHLRSGDIVILGGESRLAYHAVPRIMYASGTGQLPKCFGLGHDQLLLKGDEDAGRHHEDSSERIPDSTNNDLIMILTDKASDVDTQHSGKLSASSAVLDAETSQSGQCHEHSLPSESVESNAISVTDEASDIQSGKNSIDQNPSDSLTMCANSAIGVRPVIPFEKCSNRLSQEQLSLNTHNDSTISLPSNDIAAQNVFSICDKHSQHLDVNTVSSNFSIAMKDLSREDHWRKFEEYLKHARINISVRQVTRPGKGFPVKESPGEASDTNMMQSGDPKRTKLDDS